LVVASESDICGVIFIILIPAAGNRDLSLMDGEKNEKKKCHYIAPSSVDF